MNGANGTHLHHTERNRVISNKNEKCILFVMGLQVADGDFFFFKYYFYGEKEFY